MSACGFHVGNKDQSLNFNITQNCESEKKISQSFEKSFPVPSLMSKKFGKTFLAYVYMADAYVP